MGFSREWLGDDVLRVRFQLPRGCFATAVLAAFCDTVDASQSADYQRSGP
jgi:tRNA pseudouridine13 synthase